ncbi:MAG: toll/interleukin-1 receptor domain-containing protein [Candidatus Nitrosotenuis sp.]
MRIPLEVFISHADENKGLAKEIADNIRKYEGINVFVAHEDLDPGIDWKKELTEKIIQCDVFIILLTDKFHHAEWTEQEVGIAHAFKKRMIPIRFDNTPTTGFMTDFQATRISYPLQEHEIKNLVDVIIAYSDEGQRHINDLIEQLRFAGSFIDANTCSRILFNTTNKFTQEQINKIAQAYLQNDQIRGGFDSGPKCLNLFQKNWKRLDSRFRDQIKPFLQYS